MGIKPQLEKYFQTIKINVMEKFKRYTFRSSKQHPELIDQIKALAIEKGQSPNSLVEEFLLDGIKNEHKKITTKQKKDEKWVYIDLLLSDFYELYATTRETDYLNQYSDKDRFAMGKLLNIHKKKQPEYDSDQTRRSFRAFFENVMNIRSNQWIYENMSVSIVLSKLDPINTILRNNGKPRQVTSSDINSIVDNR